MVRLASVALLVAIVGTPAWSQSTGPASKPVSQEDWRIGEKGPAQSPFMLPESLHDPVPSDQYTSLFAGSDLSPNSRLGLGVFGHKRDRMTLSPVTVYEVNIRQSRKPGVGFSLKF